MNRSGGIVGES